MYVYILSTLTSYNSVVVFLLLRFISHLHFSATSKSCIECVREKQHQKHDFKLFSIRNLMRETNFYVSTRKKNTVTWIKRQIDTEGKRSSERAKWPKQAKASAQSSNTVYLTRKKHSLNLITLWFASRDVCRCFMCKLPSLLRMCAVWLCFVVRWAALERWFFPS